MRGAYVEATLKVFWSTSLTEVSSDVSDACRAVVVVRGAYAEATLKVFWSTSLTEVSSDVIDACRAVAVVRLSLIHISEPTRPY